MIYGPRFGRMYLLTNEEVSAPQLRRAVGLANVARVAPLHDPAERVLCDGTEVGEPLHHVPAWLSLAYRGFDASRRVVPIRQAIRGIHWWALRTRGGSLFKDGDVESIGQLLCTVESGVSNPNCYPAALLTALLSLAAGRSCSIVIGVLSPTRLMHAWCVVDGVVPYERHPEHFLYQPLWTRTLLA